VKGGVSPTLVAVLAAGGLLCALPAIGVTVPWLFEGPLSSPGTLNLLAMCFVFGALALTYDLVFGFVGLLSFGHALYFATSRQSLSRAGTSRCPKRCC
jgi:branched-chain amino acid transport system permease protein